MFAENEENVNEKTPSHKSTLGEINRPRPRKVYPTDYLSLSRTHKKAADSISAFKPKLGYYKNRKRPHSLLNIFMYTASGLLVVVIFFLIYLTNFTDFFRQNPQAGDNSPIIKTTAGIMNNDSESLAITYLNEDGYSTDDDSHSTNIDEALIAYDLSPEHTQKLLERHYRALEAYNEQRYEDAFALFRKLSLDYGIDYVAAYWAGLSSEKLERYEEAQQWFELCLKMFSRYQPGLEKLEYIKTLLESRNQ